METMLMDIILMNYQLKKQTPKEIYNSYEETANSKETKKRVLASIKNANPHYTDEEVIKRFLNTQVGAKLNFLATMVAINPIIDKKENRQEIAECLKKVTKELEKIEGEM